MISPRDGVPPCTAHQVKGAPRLDVRFGRTADPLCMEADEALRDAMDSLKMEELLTMYTVDLDEVTEFTYMYELRTSS